MSQQKGDTLEFTEFGDTIHLHKQGQRLLYSNEWVYVLEKDEKEYTNDLQEWRCSHFLSTNCPATVRSVFVDYNRDLSHSFKVTAPSVEHNHEKFQLQNESMYIDRVISSN